MRLNGTLAGYLSKLGKTEAELVKNESITYQIPDLIGQMPAVDTLLKSLSKVDVSTGILAAKQSDYCTAAKAVDSSINCQTWPSYIASPSY